MGFMEKAVGKCPASSGNFRRLIPSSPNPSENVRKNIRMIHGIGFNMITDEMLFSRGFNAQSSGRFVLRMNLDVRGRPFDVKCGVKLPSDLYDISFVHLGRPV